MDVTSQKGGLLLYSKSSLPSKMLTKIKLPDNSFWIEPKEREGAAC